jgi:hypothetical protein
MPATPPQRRRRRPWRFLRIPFLLAGGYAAAVGVCLAFENTLVHYPRGGPDAFTPKPTDRIEDVTLTTADRTAIHAWWLPPDASDHPRVVLYCHGKAGNLSHRGATMVELQKRLSGCGVLQFDYPGYGKSDGFPTEAGCYAAGDAAFDWLAGRHVRPDQVVLLGESLGGGVAVELGTRYGCEAVVLVNTFTTLPDAAAHRMPWLPCGLMRNRFDSVGKLGRVRSPVLVAHGTADDRISLRQGEALFAAANEPKRFVRLDGRGHGDWACEELFAELRGFFR